MYIIYALLVLYRAVPIELTLNLHAIVIGSAPPQHVLSRKNSLHGATPIAITHPHRHHPPRRPHRRPAHHPLHRHPLRRRDPCCAHPLPRRALRRRQRRLPLQPNPPHRPLTCVPPPRRCRPCPKSRRPLARRHPPPSPSPAHPPPPHMRRQASSHMKRPGRCPGRRRRAQGQCAAAK
ncbi:hypothetical protein BU14_0235s0008 [Porphyra umbilicalis]|uniref:Uncharacterized protein n=1 Tax=Porphyra umbilicalis TaxID=2786 RepID=A0A1X6P3J9_PORUM|nr:hypothetical protein BU14_0235s0008 [Porphyra umbilicalis]|eukprot:OSX75459.1 hypothetical protein BU14_0235s0008 [Porphyra umbilicalis]